ncbi:hypothetical protein [Cupriavidus basilensis]
MKERPILFSGAMVRAILDGRKTQTRRVVKPQPTSGLDGWDWSWPIPGKNVTPGTFNRWRDDVKNALSPYYCPYGQPGDRLWVREAWSIDMLGAFGTDKGYESTYELTYKAGGDEREIRVLPSEPDPYIKLYDTQRGDWRPSIHMPRWASRITLEITGVRVERLQDMEAQTAFESDALKEGIHAIHHGDGDYYYNAFRNEPHPRNWVDPADAFKELWESINGAGAWEANPWVWVVEFRRVV